jgi:hypothetical protein
MAMSSVDWYFGRMGELVPYSTTARASAGTLEGCGDMDSDDSDCRHIWAPGLG